MWFAYGQYWQFLGFKICAQISHFYIFNLWRIGTQFSQMWRIATNSFQMWRIIAQFSQMWRIGTNSSLMWNIGIKCSHTWQIGTKLSQMWRIGTPSSQMSMTLGNCNMSSHVKDSSFHIIWLVVASAWMTTSISLSHALATTSLSLSRTRVQKER